jgi:hypothetical protein
VERFQRGERAVMRVSATEGGRAYLPASCEFLPVPLTVARSRAKRKMVLVPSESALSPFSPDDEAFANSPLWKNLLRQGVGRCLGRGAGRETGGSVGRQRRQRGVTGGRS